MCQFQVLKGFVSQQGVRYAVRVPMRARLRASLPRNGGVRTTSDGAGEREAPARPALVA